MTTDTISKKSLETFLTRIAIQGLAVVGNIIIARALGAYGKGIFTYIGATIGLLITFTAGQSAAVAWQFAKQKLGAKTIYAAMQRILAAVTVPVICVCIVLSVVQKSQWPLAVVAAALPFSVYNQASSGFFLARGNVRAVNMQLLITSGLFSLALILVLIVAHLGMTGLIATWLACLIAASIYTRLQLQRYLTAGEPHGATPPVRDQFWFGAKVSLNALVSYLNFRIDIFIILAMLGAKALGIYSIGIGAGQLVWQLSRPIGTAAFGRIASGTEKQAAELTAKCMRHSIGIVLAAAICIYFFAPALITLVYGTQFAPAGAVVRFLLPGIVMYSAMPILSTFFTQQMSKPVVPLVFSAVSTILCAIITLLTVRKLGILGGAVATSLSYLVSFIGASIYFIRKTGISAESVFILSPEDLREYVLLLRAVWRRAAHLFAR